MKKLLKKEIGFILLELIATAADSLCIAAIPYLEKQFIDLFSGNQLTTQSVGTLVLAFGLAVALYLLFNTGAIYFGFLWDAHFEKAVKDALFHKLLTRKNRLPSTEEKAKFTHQVTVEIQQLEEDWLGAIEEELQMAIMLVAYIGFIYITLDRWIAVGVLVLSLASVAATRALHIDTASARKVYLDENVKAVTFMEQSVGGLGAVREDCTQSIFERSVRQTQRVMRERLRYGRAKATQYSADSGVSYVAMFLFFAYVVFLSYRVNLSVSAAVVSFGYIEIVIEVLGALLQCRTNRKSAAGIADGFEAALAEETSCRTRQGKVSRIQAEQVSYAVGSKAILREVSFTLDRAQSCIIHGCNGAGKSTLMKLVLNLICPQSGELLINGEPVSEGELYADLYYVEQSTVLFSASFRDNVTMFGAYDMAKLEKYPFLQRPELQKIRSCENCDTLSGGEKQLVCLCRALLSGAHWLMLDESFSGIAPALEEEILRELLASDHTLLYISHREGLESLFPRTLTLESNAI